MPTTSDYLAKIPRSNAVQPNFMAVIAALVQPLADLQSFLGTVPDAFDLDTAIGVQLDQVGLWIGRTRYVTTPIENVYFSWDIDGLGWEQGYWQGTFDPGTGITALSDEPFRQLLYAKAAANQWDGSYYEIYGILDQLLIDQGVTAQIIDNFNMSMSVQIIGQFNDQVMMYLLLNNEIPIKPEGVAITYNFDTGLPPTLGASLVTAGGSLGYSNTSPAARLVGAQARYTAGPLFAQLG